MERGGRMEIGEKVERDRLLKMNMSISKKFNSSDSPLYLTRKGGIKGNEVEKARQLRKQATGAEKILWQVLRNRKLNNLKFRRQHPIASYIVDFYCAEVVLIVELDGSIHTIPDEKDYDVARQEDLEGMGYRVLRFTNTQVEKDMNNVLSIISNTAEEQKKTLSH